MNFRLSSVNKTKVGTCPHGLPAGACPICSGMGGGCSTKKTERPKGEMSWDECYAVWQQMLRSKELAQQKRLDTMQAQLQKPVNFTARLENVAQKIANLAEKLTDLVQKTQTAPSILQKSLIIAAKIAIPMLNTIKNIPILAQKAINFVQTKLADISDKLAAVFGELKNSLEKKISDKLKDFKKKFKSIFGLFESEENIRVRSER
ncbi:MAG: hypothetical protein PHC64_00945 [Candidatus Gastranaerophilales bacterium]|nr:hypothetical protein [Candidatus Gastranaerophilales bacterium]